MFNFGPKKLAQRLALKQGTLYIQFMFSKSIMSLTRGSFYCSRFESRGSNLLLRRIDGEPNLSVRGGGGCRGAARCPRASRFKEHE